jgi:hypothetical protein
MNFIIMVAKPEHNVTLSVYLQIGFQLNILLAKFQASLAFLPVIIQKAYRLGTRVLIYLQYDISMIDLQLYMHMHYY